MTKTPTQMTPDSLDVQVLLAELLRTQEERDRLWAEKELLREKLQLATSSLPDTHRTIKEGLPEKLGRLAHELVAAAHELQAVAHTPAKPAVNPEVEHLQSHSRNLEHELTQARERIETLETQLRVMEISARSKGLDAQDADIREQLAAALEREDQLLIRLHQQETTLAQRQADQLSLLEKDKQIQQLKYFLHQGALDFEKLQTRFRVLEAENLEHKHRIIDLQTQLERQQTQARNTLTRMQEQTSKLEAKLLDSQKELEASRTRVENLEDEIERLSQMLAQAEDREVKSAGHIELLRHTAARVPELTNMVAELEWERMGLIEDRNRLLEELTQWQETVNLLEEHAAQLEERLNEEALLRKKLQDQINIVTAEQTGHRDTIVQLETALENAHETVQNLQNALHHEKTHHDDNMQKMLAQIHALQAQLEDAIQERDTLHVRIEEQLRETEQLRVELASTIESTKHMESKIGDIEKISEQCQQAQRESEILLREVELRERQIAQLSESEKVAKEEIARLQETVSEFERLRVSSERTKQELSMRNARIAELESQLASAQIDLQRLAGQVKTAESRNVEINHWADKLRNELQQVRVQLDTEIQQRQQAEGRARSMEVQLPEIRRLFDEIEHQVDGFEDSLVLEEERTQRLNESLDSLVSSIGDVFEQIAARIQELDSQKRELTRQLEDSERKLQLSEATDVNVVKQYETTIHDLNVQLGIMEGNLLTMQVKLQNQLPSLKERILRVSQDLGVLGMIHAAEELRTVAEKLVGLASIDGMT